MLLAATVIAGVILGTSLLAIFWRDIQTSFIRIKDKVKQMFGRQVEGMQFSIERRQGQMKKVMKTYHNEAGVWRETVARKNVAESEIPEEYRQRVQRLMEGEELDMTEEFAMQLTVKP